MSEITRDNKYKRLMGNTVLFTISSFSSKLLSFFLTPYLSGQLPAAEYGRMGPINAGYSILFPLVSLSIVDAVTRFTLDESTEKDSVFSAGLATILAGMGVFLMFAPLVAKVPDFAGMSGLIYVYMFTSMLRLLCCQFVRSRLYTRLYAIDGILASGTVVLFAILNISVFHWGLKGYYIAVIASDIVSILFVSLVARLWKYVAAAKLKWNLWKAMLRYSLPLVPSNMSWWIISASDRFFISAYHGNAVNGVYEIASKIPALIAVLVTIFSQSWQLSAVLDGQDQDQTAFFSEVYSALLSLAFMAGAGLIMLSEFITGILAGRDALQEAKIYVPMLVLGAIFSCFSTFLNSIYLLKRKTVGTLITILIGAAVNVLCNALLIKPLGLYGAALSTLISAVLIYLLRLLHTRRELRLQTSAFRFAANLALICLEVVVATLGMARGIAHWQLWCLGIVVLMLLLNLSTLWHLWQFFLKKMVLQYLPKRKR